MFGQVSPLVADAFAEPLKDDTIFGFGPWGPGNFGIEVVVPAFTTLFSNPTCVMGINICMYIERRMGE